ncbi:hypothetical protein BT69DRAFT_1399522 [Atractiella rhizophila]|nr:hypothetical protein BT69DRAFT_1343224 [Atractiella rhizophila]KAH8926197.1 hypothetical protein BT69DRAFT_1399522 [Atractiella rhizophila]
MLAKSVIISALALLASASDFEKVKRGNCPDTLVWDTANGNVIPHEDGCWALATQGIRFPVGKTKATYTVVDAATCAEVALPNGIGIRRGFCYGDWCNCGAVSPTCPITVGASGTGAVSITAPSEYQSDSLWSSISMSTTTTTAEFSCDNIKNLYLPKLVFE